MDFPIDLLRTFLAIVDSGSFTTAGQQVHRTQSAVSMQIKRLEETIGRPVFNRIGRSFTLTMEGESLIPYARRMLKLHEETVAALIRPEMVGAVRIGTPDDYAAQILPEILSRFAQTHPHVQVAVYCQPSSELSPALEKGDIDLALLTGDCYLGKGEAEVVRRDPTLWVTSASHLAHEHEPLPLAIFQSQCVFRDWAFQALDAAGRPYRIAYQSASVAGILAAVSAGLAVTVLAGCIVPTTARVLTEKDGFPPLPETTIVLKRSPGAHSQVIDCMATYIREEVSNRNV
ncbi:MAG: LysR family transcriptional regulator [Deltaproteobacteria bacterium]|nr:LysR family transcriptional regulator [Deltaproteobacteria bacterium]